MKQTYNLIMPQVEADILSAEDAINRAEALPPAKGKTENTTVELLNNAGSLSKKVFAYRVRNCFFRTRFRRVQKYKDCLICPFRGVITGL